MDNSYLEDHGLPLVQLKEQRREMVAALTGQGLISKQQISDIAAVQQAIAAMEAVITDLDAEIVAVFPRPQDGLWLTA
jgi:hypothetical protein